MENPTPRHYWTPDRRLAAVAERGDKLEGLTLKQYELLDAYLGRTWQYAPDPDDSWPSWMDVRLSGKKVVRKLEPRSPERGSASHLYVDMLSAANEAGAWKNAQSDLVDVHDNSKGTQSITQFVRRREAASELRDLLVTMAQAAGLEGYIDTTELDVLNQAWESLEPLLLAFQDESIRPAVEGLLVTWEGTPEDLLTSLGDVNSRISLRTPPKRTSDPHTR